MEIQRMSQPVNEFILKDDEVLVQFFANQDRLFASNKARVSARAASATKQFFKQHVLGHFAYEERHVFPGLLQAGLGPDVARAVADIRKDHRALCKEVKQLTALLATTELSRADMAKLRVAMAAFGKHLERHSTMENKLFPSLV